MAAECLTAAAASAEAGLPDSTAPGSCGSGPTASCGGAMATTLEVEVRSRHLEVCKERVPAGNGLAVEVATIVRLPNMPQACPAELRLGQQFQEDEIAPLFDGSVWAGTRVWEASVALIDEVIDRFGEHLAAGARVAELGCGLGLPGMVCAALGARVVLTDVEEVLDLLQRNVDANFGHDVRSASPGPGHRRTIRAAALDWNLQDSLALLEQEGGDLELVLCCDCVYEPLYGESWKALAVSLKALCGPSTTALVSLQRRRNDGVDDFLACLSESFCVERLCSALIDDSEVLVYSATLLEVAAAA